MTVNSRVEEWQQLMNDRLKDDINHAPTGRSGTEAGGREVPQAPEVKTSPREPTVKLMEQICAYDNLNQAYKRVKANKGAAGIDGMTTEQLFDYLKIHGKELIDKMLDGSYQAQPVREVEISKPNGGVRKLGIPTVVDRWVQQAILQVLEPIIDPTLSESSYGFRPKRSAHDALKQASEYVVDGRVIVVDIDLEKFFDRVNHDILMSKLARRIGDRRLLKIIRGFLNAGIMRQGVCTEREQGVPQGGSLSPLLSNILLDKLDKELERRNHKFCRYADDCNIYVCSQEAGERVYKSIQEYLWKRLKLKVNEEKSAVAAVETRKFLGYRILKHGGLDIAPQSLERAKDKIRKLTRRTRGRSLASVIQELKPYLTGWCNYFKLVETGMKMQSLDGWIRRKLRCYRLKQRKKCQSIATWLMGLGASKDEAFKLAGSSKGWWRLSLNRTINKLMSNAWFEAHGLVSLHRRYTLLNT